MVITDVLVASMIDDAITTIPNRSRDMAQATTDHELGEPQVTPGGQAAQRLWSQGDYTKAGTRIFSVAEELCEVSDVRGGMQVLDVATGHGNVAIAAARREAAVTAVDIVPDLLAAAQRRLAADGLAADLRVGNAEALDQPDDAFDRVLSCVGVQFAADQTAVAAELQRVCRAGGRIGLACWTPKDLWTELPALVAEHQPPPAGAPSPMTWGTEDGLRSLFGESAEIELHDRVFRFRNVDAQSWVDLFAPTYPPFVALRSQVDDSTAARFDAGLLELVERWNEADDGSLVLPLTYHVALITP